METRSPCLLPPPVKTPVVRLQNHGWRRLSIKDESKQLSGAFKYRGNFHKVSALPSNALLVAASTGNHAAGLAIAASAKRLQFIVFVPTGTSTAKIERIRHFGGIIIPVKGGYSECEAEARLYCQHERANLIHGFDDPDIISGHQSLFREVEDQIGCPDVAFVQIGGGGLISAGIKEWFNAPTQIIGIEHEGAPAMQKSLAAGRLITLDSIAGIAEGLLVRRVGSLAFNACTAYGLTVRIVRDADIYKAMRILYDEAGIRAEGAGAAAVAAALKSPDPQKEALCVVTGGNIDECTWNSYTRESTITDLDEPYGALMILR